MHWEDRCTKGIVLCVCCCKLESGISLKRRAHDSTLTKDELKKVRWCKKWKKRVKVSSIFFAPADGWGDQFMGPQTKINIMQVVHKGHKHGLGSTGSSLAPSKKISQRRTNWQRRGHWTLDYITHSLSHSHSLSNRETFGWPIALILLFQESPSEIPRCVFFGFFVR